MPIMPKRLPSKELFAFEFLRQKGMRRVQIQAELGISRRTYYRRLAQLGRMKELEKHLMSNSA